jgi:uroporphyrin-3 C-methyltransferase
MGTKTRASFMKDETPDPTPSNVDEDQSTSINTDNVTENKQRRDVSVKLPIFVYLLILSVVLGISVGAFWVWKQTNERLAETEKTLIEMTQQIEAFDIKPELNQLRENLDSQTKNLSNQLNEQQRLQESLGHAVIKAHTSATRRQREWVVAEAFYLVELATQRLQLMRDINTAIIALQAANKTLQELGDPSFMPLRDALDTDINNLKAFPLPGLASIEQKLNQILIHYNPLPIKPDTQQGTPIVLSNENQSNQNESETSTNPLLTLIQELNKHLVVRHHDEPLQPQPSLQAQLYQHQILRLRLEAARLAVLREDDVEFHNQLHAALDWLDTHYAFTTRENLTRELEELDKINIRPKLPDIGKSIEALNAIRGTIKHIDEDNT